jgi:hypothetical protein
MPVSRSVPRARAALGLLLLTILSVAPGCGDGGASADGTDGPRGTVTATNFTTTDMDSVTLVYAGGQISAFGIGPGGTATFTHIPYGSVTATGYFEDSSGNPHFVASASGTLDSPSLTLNLDE